MTIGPTKCPQCGSVAIDFRGPDFGPQVQFCENRHEWPVEQRATAACGCHDIGYFPCGHHILLDPKEPMPAACAQCVGKP